MGTLSEAFQRNLGTGLAAIDDSTAVAANSAVRSVITRPVTARSADDAARPDGASACKREALR